MRVLTARFGTVPAETLAAIGRASLDEVSEWLLRVATSPDLASIGIAARAD
jgi:hypothetical protein